VRALVRAAAVAGACLGVTVATAEADIILTPFAGKSFAAQHTLNTNTATVDKQTWLVGVSATWLTDNILGAELDIGYAPRFFASNQLLNRPGSNVVSFTGNMLLTVPVSVTRDSLRPYITGGLGMMHAGVSDAVRLTEIDSNLLAFSVGGGAIGFVNRRAGVRFDLRHIRTTSRGVDNATLLTEPRLGFWRATVGVAIRY
jgi:hypothetical protein